MIHSCLDDVYMYISYVDGFKAVIANKCKWLLLFLKQYLTYMYQNIMKGFFRKCFIQKLGHHLLTVDSNGTEVAIFIFYDRAF